jgi:hypothetical protein
MEKNTFEPCHEIYEAAAKHDKVLLPEVNVPGATTQTASHDYLGGIGAVMLPPPIREQQPRHWSCVCGKVLERRNSDGDTAQRLRA